MESATTGIEKVFIGADHAGYELKEILKKHLENYKVAVEDLGPYSTDKVDYPDYAVKVAQAVVKAGDDNKNLGVLVCGSGIGISIAANKVKGVRCGLCHDHYTALMSRSKDYCNVVAVGGRVIGPEVAKQIVDVYLTTKPETDESYKRRVEKLAEIEKENLKV